MSNGVISPDYYFYMPTGGVQKRITAVRGKDRTFDSVREPIGSITAIREKLLSKQSNGYDDSVINIKLTLIIGEKDMAKVVPILFQIK